MSERDVSTVIYDGQRYRLVYPVPLSAIVPHGTLSSTCQHWLSLLVHGMFGTHREVALLLAPGVPLAVEYAPVSADGDERDAGHERDADAHGTVVAGVDGYPLDRVGLDRTGQLRAQVHDVKRRDVLDAVVADDGLHRSAPSVGAGDVASSSITGSTVGVAADAPADAAPAAGASAEPWDVAADVKMQAAWMAAELRGFVFRHEATHIDDMAEHLARLGWQRS